MDKNQLLTQERLSLKKAKPGFENHWIVSMGKEVFTLNQKEAEVLHKATVAGVRGIVWFDDFAISIPHIQSINRKPIRV